MGLSRSSPPATFGRPPAPGSAALGYMATSAVLFALMNFFARLATASASWLTVGAVRAFIGAMVALVVARARGASLRAHDTRAVLWRSVFGTTAMMSTFYALSSRTLPLGDTVTLLNLTPVFLAILAPVVLRERTSAAVALAILVSLGGVALIVHPSFAFADAVPGVHGPSAGVTAAMSVFAAFSASIAMMMLRKVGQTESAEAISFQYSLFAALVLAICALFDLRMPAPRDVGFMIGAGVCAGFGQIALTRAYTLGRAARVSGMGYLAVVASALLGAAVLHERPSGAAIAGMALVIGGGLLVTFARDAPSKTT
ncbi:MAG: DMT family transporter [Labilithrix sp.]|nr:DMT family transporter [Labilithrix sp.]